MSKDSSLKDFISESEDLIESLGQGLMRLEDASKGGKKRIDPDILNGVFRAAHSLKGLAGMFGFKKMASLSHTLENLLDRMRLGKIPVTHNVLDSLFEATEKLKSIIAQGTPDADVKGLDETEKRLERTIETKGGETEVEKELDIFQQAGIGKEVTNVLTEYEEFRLKENLEGKGSIIKVKAQFDLMTFDTDLSELSDMLKTKGEIITTLPSSEPTDGNTLRFDLLVGTDEDVEVIKESLTPKGITVEVIKEGTVDEDEEITHSTLEAGSPEEASPDAPNDDTPSLKSITQTVRVDLKQLDVLMNFVGELVQTTGNVGIIKDRLKMETGMKLIADELTKAHRDMEKKLNDLREGFMQVRMVPISQIFDRLSRVVRKISRDVGKEIKFITSGGDTKLDKLLIEELADPLMHLIRNCIDHGIESLVERENAGKSPQGTVILSGRQEGNSVIIEVEDDGAGIDPEKVLNEAVSRGLAEKGVKMKDKDIFQFMFQAGFSTKKEVSELSGRGVGLDVVKRNISAISGHIVVESEVGKGTKIIITLPLTLAIIQALIVDAANKTYAVPLNSVLESLSLEPEQILTIEKQEVIELRERTLPLLRLAEVFGYDTAGKNGDKSFVIVVGAGERMLGIVVDKLQGSRDIVIRTLGKTLGNVKGIAGATVLGNQEVVLVLDIGDLIAEATNVGATQ